MSIIPTPIVVIVRRKARMSLSIVDIIVVVYLIGGLVRLMHSLKAFDNFQRLKNQGNFDILAKRTDVKRYLILSPILWPYYFITEKSPLERFSEFFFKYYGDKDHRYFGNQGLKNFLNDLIKGKERYKNCQINYLCWPIDKNSSSCFKRFDKKTMHAHIIYTQLKGQYLLSVTLSSESTEENARVSRFQLDQCLRLSDAEFKLELERISPMKAREFFS